MQESLDFSKDTFAVLSLFGLGTISDCGEEAQDLLTFLFAASFRACSSTLDVEPNLGRFCSGGAMLDPSARGEGEGLSWARFREPDCRAGVWRGDDCMLLL